MRFFSKKMRKKRYKRNEKEGTDNCDLKESKQKPLALPIMADREKHRGWKNQHIRSR